MSPIKVVVALLLIAVVATEAIDLRRRIRARDDPTPLAGSFAAKIQQEEEAGSTAAVCNTADDLYNAICPTTEADDADTMYKVYDATKWPGGTQAQQDAVNAQHAKIDVDVTWIKNAYKAYFNKAQAGVGDKIVQKFESDVMFLTDIGEFSAATPGSFLMLGASEFYVSSKYPAYMKLSLAHEMGHITDFVEGSVDGGLGADLKPLYGGVRKEVKDAFSTKNLAAAEPWADIIGADVLCSQPDITRADIIQAITPFCKTGSSADYVNPPRDRALLFARAPACFAKLCPGGKPEAQGTKATNWFDMTPTALPPAEITATEKDKEIESKIQAAKGDEEKEKALDTAEDWKVAK